ncbi:MAG: type I glyceraldehyde-3-phosphate dehydrogenase [Armatimonadetes bacterium]|nr:type I glyceraldehyde-3-phosphate dehydrogenase [Armatimonadota bacterium]
MAVKIGINGFGRIGRLSFRALQEKYPNDVEIVAINDLVDSATNAHLLKWDTTYGRFKGDVAPADGAIVVNGKTVKSFQEKDPANIDWNSVGAQIVIESTGFFTDAEKAKAHLGGSVKKVIITAPAKNEDVTLVLGVNQDAYDPAKHNVISNASCTTNCLAPVAKVLVDNFGVEEGLMTTIHSYTNDQKIQDQAHKDPRRARAGAANMIPTSTGAAKAISLVLPELKGKMHGFAMRVPTLTVSVVDLVVNTEKPVTAESVNAAMKKAAEGSMKGILGYEEEPLVSSDFMGDERSSILDANSTMTMGDHMVKVISWYDNEWGYSCRIADLVKFLKDKGL